MKSIREIYVESILNEKTQLPAINENKSVTIKNKKVQQQIIDELENYVGQSSSFLNTTFKFKKMVNNRLIAKMVNNRLIAVSSNAYSLSIGLNNDGTIIFDLLDGHKIINKNNEIEIRHWSDKTYKDGLKKIISELTYSATRMIDRIEMDIKKDQLVALIKNLDTSYTWTHGDTYDRDYNINSNIESKIQNLYKKMYDENSAYANAVLEELKKKYKIRKMDALV